jgi:hypothetical protein
MTVTAGSVTPDCAKAAEGNMIATDVASTRRSPLPPTEAKQLNMIIYLIPDIRPERSNGFGSLQDRSNRSNSPIRK